MLYGKILRQQLRINNAHVVADTIDYLEAEFAFSDDWDGLTKWAHFANGDTVYDIPLTDDCIRKEDHLNLSAGVWKVYLHGNEFADGKVIERITTCVENLRVYPTGTLTGEPFPEIPASVTEQILARLEDIEQNGGGGGGITQETDPTVPDWAKQLEKPTYTASEVGALPASTKIPAKTSDLQNDSGFITAAVNALLNYYKKSETYTRTEVDAFISGLDRRLNAVADSDDTTLDQLSEIVAYIKSNKSLIDSITTSKVSVSDIVNNLTTADAKKPLSAAQGKELKALYDTIRALYDAIVIPTKLPNPYALTFTGAASGTYDGSSAVTIEIPTGGGETVATVYMRVSGGYIQYSTDNATWKNVIAVADLKGDKGDPGQDGEDGQDGANGKDGVSATHSWNGTVLTVTSASGTSSADLKGDKGDTGEPGADGKDGQDGEPGANGITPHIGSNGNWYIGDADTGVQAQGEPGKDGQDGQPGADGKDGEDYVLTGTDKSDIANIVLELLPTWEGGSY